jgi:2'-5' RNA ligase
MDRRDGHGRDGDDAWYWGVVVRVDGADELLRRLRHVRRPGAVVPQRAGTGHVTLFYAPVRSADGVAGLAEAAAPALAAATPFRLGLGGFGEFVTPGRVVAWIGVDEGLEPLRRLRRTLCDCDLDTLAHPFVPHCTVAYGDSPAVYAEVRDAIAGAVDGTHVEVDVDALWIAGFPRGGHPADDLVYRRRLPLGPNGSGLAPHAAPVRGDA